jgi:hypothetical protein
MHRLTCLDGGGGHAQVVQPAAEHELAVHAAQRRRNGVGEEDLEVLRDKTSRGCA